MYKTRQRSVIEISNFSPLQNIAQRPRCKNYKSQNLQKSCGKILTKQSDKEAGRRVRHMRGVKFLLNRSARAKMKFSNLASKILPYFTSPASLKKKLGS